MNFEGKRVVVTGGANGIGRCIAEEFIKTGAVVFIIDTDREAGKKLEDRYPERLFFFEGDVADQTTLEAFTRQLIQRFDGIDCLVNNACLSRKGLESACEYEDFLYVLKMGVAAPYYLALLLKDRFRSHAAIVNIASSRAFMSQADTESYSAAKGGLSSLTHAMAMSLAGRVRVNAVSPGWIDTTLYHEDSASPAVWSEADKRQHPAGRIGHPLDIAPMVLYLCSEQAGFITGQNIVIDGGMTKKMIYHGDEGWRFDPDEF